MSNIWQEAYEHLRRLDVDWSQLGWSAAGSAVTSLWSKKEKPEPVRPKKPIWQRLVSFLVGLATAMALGEDFAEWANLKLAAGSFLVGIAGIGLCGYIIDRARNPTKLADDFHRIKGTRKDDKPDDDPNE